jgi:hypothetical protein
MKKIIAIIVVVIVLGFLAYTFFGNKPAETNTLVSNKNSSVKVGADLLAALATLDTLKLDTDFFKDATFKRLINFSRDIPTQPKGRSNPFAPLGTVNSTNTSTSSPANTR